MQHNTPISYVMNSMENNNSEVKFYSTETCVSNCGSLFFQTSLLNSSPMKAKSPWSQNIQMKWASCLTQLDMFSNLRNECRRGKREGQYRWGVSWQGKPTEVGGYEPWRFLTMAHADVAVVLSKSFHQPSGKEVTRNSFGIIHLCHPFLRNVSVQHWSSVGKRLAGWAREANTGLTREKQEGTSLPVWGNVEANNHGKPQKMLTNNRVCVFLSLS